MPEVLTRGSFSGGEAEEDYFIEDFYLITGIISVVPKQDIDTDPRLKVRAKLTFSGRRQTHTFCQPNLDFIPPLTESKYWSRIQS
ncbi:hypothetical protein GcM1_133004 [Golovinomyces cichoracearum]|uniref:Uncharacterized protein n=1 Tax=Golovinomyces cichoracearum TaxID=62708 RepID=A0A420JBQ5_9PEZI|nr:hypothetical protein GcM1_133004 [Golovinomyces cichoracearum]